jgi:hypothetical protein
MASPYFQSLNLAKQDHSAIGRTGEVVGKMYAQMGEAIAKVGNAYFERKGMEKKAQEIVNTPHGQEMLISNGMSKEEVAEMSEDPKKANKMMYDIIRDSGGVKEFNEKMQDFQKTQMLNDQFNQQKQLTELNIEKSELALNALEQKTADEAGIKKIFATAFKQGEDGTTTFDFNNLSYTQEESHLLPQVYEQMKSMNLLPKASYASWKTSMNKQGKYDRSNPSLMRSQFAQYMDAYGGEITGEDRRGMYTTLDKDLIEPTVIMETAKKYWQSDPNYKEWQTAEGTNDRLQAGIQTAIKPTAGGAYEIANASSAGFVVRQFARLANGVGVMTNEDVDAVKGASDARSTYERLKTQIFGDGSIERPATAQDVQNGWADKEGEMVTVKVGARASAQDILGIQEATKALMEVNTRRLEQHGIDVQEQLRTAYPEISEERLLELSPYSKYHDRAYAFTIADDDVPSLANAIETQGMDSVVNQLKEENPRIDDAQIQSMLSKAERYTNSQTNQRVEKEVNSVIDDIYSTPQSKNENPQARQDLEAEFKSGLDKKGMGDVYEMAGGAIVGKKVADWMMNNLARGNALEAMGESSGRYRQALNAFKKAPLSDLKEFAKEMGVEDVGSGKKGEKQLRSKLAQKFKQQMKGKVAEYLAKRGVFKKVSAKIIGSIFTGGTALAVGGASLMYDVMDIVEANGQVESDELHKMFAKYPKGSEERKIIETMILDRNLKSGDFKEYQRKKGGGTGNPRLDYETYRRESQGT